MRKNVSRAYKRLDRAGQLAAVCIVVDERQAKQAIKEFIRSDPGAAVEKVAVERAYGLISGNKRSRT